MSGLYTSAEMNSDNVKVDIYNFTNSNNYL